MAGRPGPQGRRVLSEFTGRSPRLNGLDGAFYMPWMVPFAWPERNARPGQLIGTGWGAQEDVGRDAEQGALERDYARVFFRLYARLASADARLFASILSTKFGGTTFGRERLLLHVQRVSFPLPRRHLLIPPPPPLPPPSPSPAGHQSSGQRCSG